MIACFFASPNSASGNKNDKNVMDLVYRIFGIIDMDASEHTYIILSF